MILSICGQNVFASILVMTSCPIPFIRADGKSTLLHADKDWLFGSLESAWIWLWISLGKHPSATLVYFCSPESFIFKNYSSRWVYFTHHVNYLLLFKIKSMLEAVQVPPFAVLCRETSLLHLTAWDLLVNTWFAEGNTSALLDVLMKSQYRQTCLPLRLHYIYRNF